MGRKGKETSVEERTVIVRAYCQGKSYRDIADLMDRPLSTIKSIISRYGKNGFVTNKKRTGCPKKLTEREERQIVKEMELNPRMSVPKLNGGFRNQSGTVVSDETVRRTLRTSGLNGRVAANKPFISPKNRLDRLEYARLHVDKDQAYWNTILFTDESKFNVFQSDGKVNVWRRKGERLNPKNIKGTVKHGGGSVLVWGCMSATGVGSLVFIEGIMDHKVYIDILKTHLESSVTKLGIRDTYIFSQDNDPKHTAFNTRLWLLYNTRKQVKTPAQSPDLNPIEHLWAHLERKIRGRRINNKNELKTALQEEWSLITPEITGALVGSMKRRMEAVITSNGGPTKY